MPRLIQNVLRKPLTWHRNILFSQHRNASLTGAISKGIRKGQSAISWTEKGLKRSFDENGENSAENRSKWRSTERSDRSTQQNGNPRVNANNGTRRDEHSRRPQQNDGNGMQGGMKRRDEQRSNGRIQSEPRRPKDRSDERSSNETTKYSTAPPMSIPFTTAGSEFLYGTFAVDAAIRAQRRKLYKLYVYHNQTPEEKDKTQLLGIRKRAMATGIKIVDVAGAWRTILNKMSANRPHNGIVLEASSLPKLPVTSLEQLEAPDDRLTVKLGRQSLEDRTVNSTFEMEEDEAYIPSIRPNTRYPFLLFLDCILDPENLGAICRSAFYLGVDAIILPRHRTAPFSAVTLKASAGAAEHVPILHINDEVKFVKASQQNGWRFFAAVAPDSGLITSQAVDPEARTAAVRRALREAPTVLMLGGEGEGLRPYLERLADGVATIVGARGKADGLDSLNVSVAAALLMRDFLSPPSLANTVSTPEIDTKDGTMF